MEEKLIDIEEQFHEQKKLKKVPKIGDYRMRAHINIFSDTPFPYPQNPNYVDWSIHYPQLFNREYTEKLFCNTPDYPLKYEGSVNDSLNGKQSHQVDFADIGCGFGVALSKKFPKNLSFGMEIRDKLVNYIGEKIVALRYNEPSNYNNISVVRTNAQRHITNYFRKEQLSKLFFCFPDPHFKRQKHRMRIISTSYLSEYAYVLKPKGRIYCITDVEYLHEWHEEHLGVHSQFKKLSQQELDKDVNCHNQECIQLIFNETEEGKRVTRNNGSKFCCVYEKI